MNRLSENEFGILASKISDCFFMVIGANDGVTYDPLHKHIIEYKWKGMFVEPDENSMKYLRLNYNDSRDYIYEQCVVSNKDGEVDLFCGKTGLHYTLSLKQAKFMFDVEPTAVKTPCFTPQSLLEKHNITKVDVLMIDTEGYDCIILKAFPFDTIKPKLVRAEFSWVFQENNSLEEMKSFLESFNYTCFVDESNNDIIGVLNENTLG